MARPNKTVAKIKSEYMNKYDAQMERARKKKRRLISRLVLFAIVTVFLVSLLSIYHIKQRIVYAEKKSEYDALTEQMVMLEKDEKDLLEEINLLNDDEYILDIARTNYFLSKKGEMIFLTPDEDRSY